MIEKILKVELIGFLLLTLVTVVYALYGGQFPDNFLSISSYSESINFLSYYLFSLFSIIGMIIGPWIIVPFLFFVLFYQFIYSKRDYKLDIFLVGFLVCGFALFFSLAFSAYLGEGLITLIEDNFTPESVAVLMILNLALFMVSTFRKTSLKFFKQFIDSLHRFSIKDIFIKLHKSSLKTKALLNRPTEQNGFTKTMVAQEKLDSNLGDRNGILKMWQKTKKMVLDSSPTELKEKNKEIEVSREIDDLNPPAKKETLNGIDESLKSSDIKEESTINKVDKLPSEDLSKGSLGSTSQRMGKSEYKNLISGINYKEGDDSFISPEASYFQEIRQRIEEKLNEFNINAKIINVLKGPVVDTFELELGEGVQLSKVTNRQEDVSLALYGAPIRMVYPLKGKTTIGIEVPRNPREIIFLGEIIQSKQFREAKGKLPIAMGKDAFGEPFVADLASMPHMLVAGATGAGKSVFINALLVSLLVKLSPEELKLILIDPKQLELALYQNLPHLSLPVITDSGMAMNSLLWAVQEMEKRYSILKDMGVRNIATYNEKVAVGGEKVKAKIGKYFPFHEEVNFKLPYIVIIIDEFADLMLTKNGKEIEMNVSRLAAKARAAGIHLVLATQRPSVDVITGVIKSNFPTRVSFKVTTGKDSSTILDRYGAEKLLGKGDMLFKQGVENVRVHSSYIEEDEIEQITDSLSISENVFDQDAIDFLENGPEDQSNYGPLGNGDPSSPEDPLFSEAIEVVLEAKIASASMLQRRLKVGYNRAANLVEALESKGIVGPANGSKGREVLGRK